jgi:hypothetical protein
MITTEQAQSINPKDIVCHTVDSFRPRTNPNEALIYDHTSYSMFHPSFGWASIEVNKADALAKEWKRTGMSYRQVKLNWYLQAIQEN